MKKRTIGRRAIIKGGLLGGAAVLAAPMINRGAYQLFAATTASYSKRAVDLVAESLVIDMLSLFDMGKLFTAMEEGTDPLKMTKKELERVKESGIDIFHPAIGMGGMTAYEDALQFMAAYNGLAAENPDLVMRVDSIEDMEALKKNGKIGFILGLQNSEHFRTVADVKTFYHVGQRVSQLTYNTQNMIASGSTDRVDGGISDFGAEIVKAMNELGMAVDVSHCGDQTTLDAFELSKKPVLITHSNARALAPGHPRCKTDEAIRAMAKSGGVMGITAVRNFVKNDEPTTIEDYVDHIDHVAKLVGVEHVGVGTDSDLDGYDDLPPEVYKSLKEGYKSSYAFREKIDIEGLDHPKKMFDLTEALIRRGYGNKDIKAILGGNFKRVLGKIWTA